MYIINNNPGQTKPFAMIGHPKTATQSCRKALCETHQAEVVAGQHGVDEDKLGEILEAGGLVVSTVRNPYDAFVSWYHYSHVESNHPKYSKDLFFSQWLKLTLEDGNGWIEKGLFYGVEHCNRLIRFEHNIETQLNNVLGDCGLGPVLLGCEGSTEHLHYSEYYDLESAIAVTRYCYHELEEFGYQFEKP